MKLAIHHPSRPERLALQDGELPTLELRAGQHVARAVKDTWGLRSWVLHDGGWQYGLKDIPLLRLQALTEDLPAGLTWGIRSVPPLPGAREWQQPGWPARVTARLDAALAQHGLQRTGEVRPLDGSDQSRVHLAATNGGDVFLKACLTPHEAQVTQVLTSTLPELLPPLLHADPHSGDLITLSGGSTLDGHPDLPGWLQAVQHLATVQQRAEVGALTRLGCPAYPLAEMTEAIHEFLTDTALLREWGLDDDRTQTLQAARPRLHALVRDLHTLGLPDLPAHGDAHPRNVLHGERGTVWFDWSEVATAHPFMDMGWFLTFALHPTREHLPIRQAHPDLERHLTHAYLTALGAPDAAPLLSRSVPLAMLHRAVVYDRHYRHWQGTIPGWRPMFVPYYLRNAAREIGRL